MLPGSHTHDKKAGLAYWAQRVLEECDKASQDFAADPVHDLRVAIRRCRSMADGFLSVDPDPAWKEMKRLGKTALQQPGRTARYAGHDGMGDHVCRKTDDPVRHAAARKLWPRKRAS